MTINLYNTDCMQALREMSDNQYDLAIVDPPYGINADIKNNTNKKQSKKSAIKSKKYGEQIWDTNIPPIEYFIELKRVSKRQIVWGVNYFPYDILKGGRLFWNKNVTMPTYSKGEIAYVSHITSVEYFEYTWHGMLQGDMQNKENRIHPTQKPVRLYEWILHKYAKKGDRILDTHLGSGSIALACHTMGYSLDAYEIDAEYFAAASARLHEHQKQLRLFV